MRKRKKGEFGVSVELHNANTPQTVYFDAVVMPEVMQVLQKHAKNLEELGQEEK